MINLDNVTICCDQVTTLDGNMFEKANRLESVDFSYNQIASLSIRWPLLERSFWLSRKTDVNSEESLINWDYSPGPHVVLNGIRLTEFFPIL
jgi:hypothetical protein